MLCRYTICNSLGRTKAPRHWRKPSHQRPTLGTPAASRVRFTQESAQRDMRHHAARRIGRGIEKGGSSRTECPDSGGSKRKTAPEGGSSAASSALPVRWRLCRAMPAACAAEQALHEAQHVGDPQRDQRRGMTNGVAGRVVAQQLLADRGVQVRRPGGGVAVSHGLSLLRLQRLTVYTDFVHCAMTVQPGAPKPCASTMPGPPQQRPHRPLRTAACHTATVVRRDREIEKGKIRTGGLPRGVGPQAACCSPTGSSAALAAL